jgi:hypothetical protein
MKNQLKVLSAVLTLALAGQVSAATTWTTWTVGQTVASGNNVPVSVVAGNNSAVTSTSSGWADTGTGTGTTRSIESQTLSSYPGLAITNKDACGTAPCDTQEFDQPEHAIDNNERYEMVMLNFSSAVQLAKMQMSWAGGGDSDVTVMAYTGGGAPSSLEGKTWTAASLTGWSVIGNYANVSTNLTTINSGGTFSSHWLIGAYNPLGGSNVVSGIGDQNDYVKLSAVTGCVQGTVDCGPRNNTPEPGSLVLMGIGLFGLVRMRKARQGK